MLMIVIKNSIKRRYKWIFKKNNLINLNKILPNKDVFFEIKY